MSKQIEKPEIIKREIGERVDLFATLEPDSIKATDDGMFEAVITTSAVDRQQESIATEGIDTSTWEKTGMPVLYGHDYSGLPIGKGVSFKSFKNKMTSKFQLAVEEYDFAGTIAKLIKGKYLNAVSIGGIVKEWSKDYSTILQMEMVEFSVVPVPANAGALITQRSLKEMTGKTAEQIHAEYTLFSKDVLLDKMADMEDDEVKDAVKTLKNLTARLEETAEKRSLSGAKKKTITRLVLADAKAVAQQSQKVIKVLKLKEETE